VPRNKIFLGKAATVGEFGGPGRSYVPLKNSIDIHIVLLKACMKGRSCGGTIQSRIFIKKEIFIISHVVSQKTWKVIIRL
jgi:hypothetical protein